MYENTNNGFNTNPNMPQGQTSQPVQSNHHNNNKTLLLIGILIVILAVILIINIKKNKVEKQIDIETMQVQSEIRANDEITKTLDTQGTSDEVSDIEKDLNATNIDSLDM